MYINSNYLVVLAFLISFLMTFFVIPKIMLISFKNKLFDVPDYRKVHKRITSRLGGVAFFPVILFSLGLTSAAAYAAKGAFVGADLSHQLVLSMCSLILLFLVGIADDLIGVGYRKKFIVQICCGIMLICSGLWINNLYGFCGIHSIPLWMGAPITIFIVVFIINSINLIDGIDGLASGLSSITMAFFGALLLYQGKWAFAIFAFASLGSLLPFFYYNVIGASKKKHKIFMGDTGSLTIGMIISILAVKLTMCDDTSIVKIPNTIVVVFSALIVPLLDVVRVVLHRFKSGKPLFKPDTNHIHHKFLALGFSQTAAMLIILLIAALFAILNLMLANCVNINLLIIFDIFAWTLMHIAITRRILKTASSHRKK